MNQLHERLHDDSGTIDRIMARLVGGTVGGKLNGSTGTIYRWRLRKLDPDALDRALVAAFGDTVAWQQAGDSIIITVPNDTRNRPAIEAG